MNIILGCQHASSSASRLGSFNQKPRQSTMPVLVLLVLLCGITAAVQAQTAVYNGGITSTINSTFAGPLGVTTDSSGDIFVTDNNFSTNTATVYEMTYTAGTATYSAPQPLQGPAGGFPCPATVSESDPCLRGVAIDHNGNLWVAAFGDYPTPAGQVYVYSSGTSQPPVSVGTGTWKSPWGITADTLGNVYVTDNAAQTITKIANGATPTPTLTAVYTYTGGPNGVQQPRGIAVDSSADLFVIDGNAGQVKELPAPYTGTPNTVSPGFQGPGDLALDAKGNIWVSEFSTDLVGELAGWNATTSTFATVLSWGTGLNSPTSVFPDSTTGNILVSDNGNQAIKQIALQPANFGSVAVGSTSTIPQTLTFTVIGTTTTFGVPVIVTQGATSGSDFIVGGSGGWTCTPNNGNTLCTVTVNFAPKAPGLRFGAVELQDTSNSVLATAPLFGTGAGQELVFNPGALTTAFTGLGSGVLTPEKIAVDSSGNVFIADNNGGIFEITAGTTAANHICCATSLSEPYGIAIDGAGNLFVTQSTGVYEILAPGHTTVQQLASGFSFSFPLGLAFDGNGNLYVADASAANKVDELTWASGYSNVITLSHPFGKPFGVAVDTSGNVWVADYGKSPIAPSVTELSAAGIVSGTYSGFNTPEAVAVDPAGNVYVADNGGATITELIAANSYASVTLASGASVPAITNPAGVALDSAGNVYYTTNGADDSAYKLNFASAPTLAFGSVPYQTTSTQPVTVTNIGTTGSDLNLTALSATTSFTLGTSPGDCTAPSSLVSDTIGASCALSIIFTPQSTGSISGTATITDNAAGSPQIINLSGSGTQVTATVAAANAAAPYSPSAQNVTLTATVTTAGPTVNEGTVAFTVLGTTGGTVTSPTVSGGTASVTYVIPAGQTSGNYTIQAAYNDASGGFSSSTDTTHTLSIGLANQATLTANVTSPVAYNSTQTLSTTGGSGTGAVTYSVGSSTACSVTGTTLSITSGTGTCSVTATKAADSNYNEATSAPAAVTVQPATQATLTVNVSSPATYGTQQTLTITGGNGGGAVTYSVGASTACSVSGATLTINAGSGTCSVTATKAADSNYNEATSAPAAVTVQPATQATLTANVTSPAAYNSTQTLSTTGGNGGGAVTFSVGSSTACSVTGTTLSITSGTGTCSVTATKAADSNYNAATSAPAAVTVQPATQATLTVNVSSPATYGTQQTLTITGGNGGGAATYSVGASTACSVSGATLTINAGSGTCSVTATKAADTNYNSATSTAATVTAQPAIAIVTAPPAASAITYGQTLSSSTLSGGSATPSAGSFQWVTPTTVPLARTQSESVIFVPTDTVDYSNSASVTVNVTVNPASFIVTVSSDDSGTASNCTPQTTPGHGTDASCSLRDALLEATATGGGNITFDATAFGTAKTITLANGVLSIPLATTIAGATTGSGASLVNLVTVDGNGASTIFTVNSGVTGASIANLTIQHGNNAGIRNSGALALTGDSVTSNTNSGAGGGILNEGGLTLTGSTISGNTAGTAGGGIYNNGTLTLSDDTVTGNSASTSGGGIYNQATLVVSDSTLSANTAATASGGGGIDNIGSGTAALANSVLSGNTSNSASDDFDGVAYTNSGGNIVGVVNGATVNVSAIDLAPLGSYGGSTQTLIPLPGSPAICAGLTSAIPSGLTTDQRGLPNTNASYPSYAACVDAGAVQTNYALSFTTQPTGGPVSTDFPAAVTLTESGSPFQPGVAIPLTLNGSGTLTGGSAATSGGVASYTLQVDTATAAGSSDTLTANLALNPALFPAVAISATSNTFGVGMTTPTVGLSLSSNSITYGTLETLTANVPSAATGSVNFYNNGSALLGTGTVSGGVATFSSSTLAPGSFSITASYSGDSNYNPNTSSAQLLTVNQATATVTLGSLSQTYTGSPLSATATTSPTGLTVTFTYNGSATASTAAGSYTVVGTINDPNYQGTATGTMTIAKATETVTWTPVATISYGTALAGELNASAAYKSQNVAGTFSYTAQPTGGTATLVTGTTVLPAGTYTLATSFTPSDSTDYNTVTDSAAITVTQPSLTVAANNAMRVYGVANPVFTGSVTGAVNGDTFTETFSTTATITSNAGTYSIVPTAVGANLADYAVTVQNGTLTITQAGTTTSLGVSSGSITPGQSVTLTAQVTSATTGTPTGSVNFYDGNTLLNMAPISTGKATFTTSALSAGITHQLTAVYNGDINFTTSSTSQSIPIVVAPLDFTLSAAVPVSQTVNAGGAATYQVVVAPLYGNYPGPVTFTVTGLPSGAVAAFTPSSIPANDGQQTVAVSIQTAAATAALQPAPLSSRTRVPLALALLLLPLIGVRRLRRQGRNLSRMLCALFLLLGMATMALSGCGGHAKSETATNYTLTITATSGNVQHSTEVTLTVN